MKLSQLHAFVKIVELGSFSAAARDLHIAQTAVTQRIAALEETLGVAVLTRSAFGSEATTEGQTLYRHAKGILRSVDIARAEVASPHNVEASVLISLPSTLSFILTAPLLARLRDSAPGIRLAIVDHASLTAAKIIAAGEVDFGLLPNAHDIAEAETLTVYTERLALVGRVELLEGIADRIRFRDLRNIPIVATTRGMNLRRLIERAEISSGVRLNIAHEQDSFATITSIVIFGTSCSILPCSMLSRELHSGLLRAVEVTDPKLEYAYACAWKADRPLTKAAAIVRSELIATMVQAHADGLLRGQMTETAMEHFNA